MSKKQRRKKVICPNCKVRLNENVNFCHNCGQENHDKRASVKMLINDFSQDYFTFDSKLFRSLKPLLFNPGFLTLEFINGKRMNYIKPIRLYLFISFITFLVFSLTKNISQNTSNDSFLEITYNEDRISEEQDNMAVINHDADSLVKIGKNFEAKLLRKAGYYVDTKAGKDEFYNKLMKNIPIFLFITIPILALILFLFFYKKERFYVDHLIYSLHLQSFIFFTILFFYVISLFTGSISVLNYLQVIIIAIYIVISAKKTYSVNYFISFIRMLLTISIHLAISLILLIGYLFLLIMYI